MSLVTCASCGSVEDARSMAPCTVCGSYLCANCAKEDQGLCRHCQSAQRGEDVL